MILTGLLFLPRLVFAYLFRPQRSIPHWLTVVT